MANRPISDSRFVIPETAQQSLSFDGVDDKLTLPFAPSIATGFSAGVWLYFDSPIATANYPRIFDWWTSNNGIRVHFNGTLQKFELAIGYTSTYKSLYSSVIPYTGRWIHLVITYDPATDTGKMYIDGVFHSQKTDFTDGVDATGQTFTVAQPSDASLILGEGEIAKIQMARLTVQNGVAWTHAQVLNLYFQNKIPSGAQEFLDLNGNVTDTSGNSNNGTLTGGAYSNSIPNFMSPRVAVTNRFAVPTVTQKSMYFNGAARATVPITPDITGFNFAFWYLRKIDSFIGRVISWESGANGFYLTSNQSYSGLALQIGNGTDTNGAAIPGGNIPTDKWVHVVGRYLPTGSKMYMNAGEKNSFGARSMTSPGAQVMSLARSSTFAGNFGTCGIKNFTFQNTTTPWTQAQITNLYYNNNIPSGAVQYSMNDVATDQNGENALTLTGTSYSTDVPPHMSPRIAV